MSTEENNPNDIRGDSSSKEPSFNDPNRPVTPPKQESNPASKQLRPRSITRDESPITLNELVSMNILMGMKVIQGGRPNTEDDAHVAKVTTQGGLELTVGLVADGVGGNAFGEEASKETVKTLFKYLSGSEASNPNRIPGLLRLALEDANEKVFRRSQNEKEKRGMATTAIVAAIYKNQLFIANVGDSRAYLLRDGVLTQLSLDHSWENDVVREGRYSAEETKNHPKAGELRRSIGFRDRVVVDMGFYPDQNAETANKMDGSDKDKSKELRVGDRILLCSDGLIKSRHDNPALPYVTDDEIIREMTSNDPQAAAEALTELADSRKVDDNASVVILEPEGARRTSKFLLNLPKYAMWFVGLVILAGAIGAGAFAFLNNQATEPQETASVGVTETTVVEETAAVENEPVIVEPNTVESQASLGDGIVVMPSDFSANLESEDSMRLTPRDQELLISNAEGSEFTVLNPFGAGGKIESSSAGLMGVVYQIDPQKFEIHCLVGSCVATGDAGGEVRLSEGQMSRIGVTGIPDDPEPADFSRFLGYEAAVPTLTPTATATSTSTPTPVPTETPTRRPAAATATPLSEGEVETEGVAPAPDPRDLDLDGVLHDPDNGQYDLCEDKPGTQANCGCPPAEVPAACGGGGGGGLNDDPVPQPTIPRGDTGGDGS